MFSNLIESGSHKRDLKRRGGFFLGTLVTYGVLLMAAGVGSIYAYNATIEDRDDYEVLAIMDFSRAREERAEPVVKKSAASKPAGGPQKAAPTATIKDLVVENPNANLPVAPEGARKLPPGMKYKFGDHTYIPPAASFGGAGEEGGGKPGGGGKDAGPLVEEKSGEGPPRMKVEPAPTPKPENKRPVRLTSEVLTGKTVAKPVPPYPAAAQAVRAQGAVVVQIVVDEQGRVISSKATSGHPLLRNAAEGAALRARFTPTLLTGQPVKVTGFITYNFVLQ